MHKQIDCNERMNIEQLSLNLDLVSLLHKKPDHLTQTTSWHGHLPFARWVAAITKPKLFVELGVHEGDSYCTFCETIRELGIGTRCVGIDAWEGDHQAGFYGDQILKRLKTYHDPSFGSFSTLSKKWFADAVPDFEDGSIDLLHIDGLHTFDAVKADFYNFLPKMSNKGVVLFHDITVRHGDFGVWAFWEEITKNYPSFQFEHSHGLGVLAVGDTPPDAISWLTNAEKKEQHTIQQLFENLGNRITWQSEEEVIRSHLNHFEDMANDQQVQIRHLNQSLIHAHRESFDLREQLNDTHKEKDFIFIDRQNIIEDRQNIIEDRQNIINALQNIQDELLAIKSTRSWRMLQVVKRYLRIIHPQPRHIKLILKPFWKVFQSVMSYIPGGPKIIERLEYMRMQRAQERIVSQQGRFDHQTFPNFPKLPQLKNIEDAHDSVVNILGGDNLGSHLVGEAVSQLAAVSQLEPKHVFRRVMMTRLELFLASGENLDFTPDEEPLVSIILILFNNAELTLQCLRSLKNEAQIPFELIIVDNASSDKTSAVLNNVSGAKVARNTDNIGFLLAVNQATEFVSSENILLLNNDATIRKGSLSAALDCLKSSKDIGAVGGRVVLLDGTLQEAGSIIWNDGSCVGYKRGAPEESPECMFRRDVDYCSGAFLLTPTRLWNELNGFDPIYAPAYYEETDYCMRLWQKGFRVVYEPFAVIDHFEFGSSESSTFALEQQQKNRVIFEQRFHDDLRKHDAPNIKALSSAKFHHTSRDRKTVLFIEDFIPRRSLGSGYPRAVDIAHAITNAGYALTIYPMWPTLEDEWRSNYNDLPRNAEIASGQFKAGTKDYLQHHINHFDIIFVSRPHNMDILVKTVPEILSGSDTKIVYDAEAIFALREIKQAQVLGKPISLHKAEWLIQKEIALTNHADMITAVSEEEAKLIKQHSDTPVHILGHRIEPQLTPNVFDERADILFVGALIGDDSPNVDGLAWFIEHVLNLVNEHSQDTIRLQVAGMLASDRIEKLCSPFVQMHGRVDDLTALYNECRIFIAPTRFAAGIPHKVHNAASHGLPCVATPLIGKQLGWTHKNEIILAHDELAFASSLVEIYQNRELWESTRRNALSRIQKECSADRFDNTIANVLNGLT